MDKILFLLKNEFNPTYSNPYQNRQPGSKLLQPGIKVLSIYTNYDIFTQKVNKGVLFIIQYLSGKESELLSDEFKVLDSCGIADLFFQHSFSPSFIPENFVMNLYLSNEDEPDTLADRPIRNNEALLY